MTAESDHLVPYTCDRCKQPITAADDGVFFITREDWERAATHADEVALRRARRLLENHERHLAGEAVLTSQSEAIDAFLQDMPVSNWQTVHDRCLEEDENERMAWYMDTERIRTFRGLLGMTMHLQEKVWVESTNLEQRLLKYTGGF